MLAGFALLVAALLSHPARGEDTAAVCDLDGDAHDALFCDGDDCNDDDATVFPGADEVADDGLDQDCDGYDASDGATWGGSGGSVFCGVGRAFPGMGALLGALLVVAGRRRR